MNSFLTNLKQKLLVFGINILLFIYSIYIKFFENSNNQTNSKVTSKKAKNGNKNAKRNTLFKQVNISSLNLFRIIETLNDVKLLDKLLNINPNIMNQQDNNGNTPLMLSIIYDKNEKLISKLLSYTSDINTKNNNGDNCLMLAIENGNKKLVDLILQTNINVNTQNNQGESPLFSAISKNRNDIVSLLLNKNINLNLRNKNGKTPIEEALASENKELIKTLIEDGATTLIKDMNDEYILFQLMPREALLKDVIEMESQSPNKKNLILTLRNKNGNTLFMEFCRLGYIKLSKFMIKHKADLNYVNHGENALTLAVREGQLEIVKLLLTCRSIDINHVTNDNKTPLRIAIEQQNIPIIKALINSGGQFLLKNENENLLRNSINTSNTEIINLLLGININVDVKFGQDKNTPLIYIIKKLMKDMNIDTSEDEELNKSSSTLINFSDYDKIEEDDRMSITSSNSSVTTLAHNKSILITDNYYSRIFMNMDPEEEDNDQDNNNHHKNDTSVLYDSDDTLSDVEGFNDGVSDPNVSFTSKEEFMEKRKSFERKNSLTNKKPLDQSHDIKNNNTKIINTDIPVLNHRASFDKHYKVKDTSIIVDDHYCDMIKSLLRYRAKVNLTNGVKDTALILACRYGLRNVVETLLTESRELKLDLDVNMIDRYGNTALHNACKKNYTSIVRLLLSDDAINVNIQNHNGNSALMIAVYENNIEIIHELLKCPNININPLNAQLETPLIAACRMNNYKVAKILLDHKAIINKRYDLNGETAIFHSIRNNNKKLTSLLLENEASVAFKNKNGKSPLAIAKEYKYKGIISLLFMHFKNLSALKNKTSTLSLNENIIRNDDKKAFFNNKTHQRNASLNISKTDSTLFSSSSSSSLPVTASTSNSTSTTTPSTTSPTSASSILSSLSIIDELKSNNKPSLKVNHNRNNSITFNRNLVNSPTPIPIVNGSYINKKHTRHESFNEITNSSTTNNGTGRYNNNNNNNNNNNRHTRHKSFNPELLTGKINKAEKLESIPNYYSKNKNKTHNMNISNFNNRNENYLKRLRSYSASSTMDRPISEFHKKISNYNLKKVNNNNNNNNNGKIKYYDESKSLEKDPSDGDKNHINEKECDINDNINDIDSNDNGNESDTEITTNLLIMKAKEKVQMEAQIESNINIKPLRKSKSQSSLKGGEPKPDDYLKPLKTACYNQDLDEIKKFYRQLVQEKGNIYQLPEDLFLQVKNCQDEKEREIITQKIKDYNKTRMTTPTTLSIDMFAFTLLYFSDNADALETMLQYGLNPNMQNNALYTLLILACKKSQPKSALVLLDYNADPNYQNKYDESALILACKKGLVDVIEKLLQCHANVNLRNDKGETALIMACWKKNINIVNRLLQTDVDINMKNNLEESPLYLSCLQNSVDIAEALLEHGADVNTCNNNNETPLMVARKNNNSKLIELLLKYGAKE